MTKLPWRPCPRCIGGQMYRDCGTPQDPEGYWHCLQCGHDIYDHPPLPRVPRVQTPTYRNERTGLVVEL